MIVKQNYLEPGKHTGSVRKASSNTSALSIQSEKKNKTNKKKQKKSNAEHQPDLRLQGPHNKNSLPRKVNVKCLSSRFRRAA